MATVITPNMDYRENHSRAVYIQEEINADLVLRLTPRINELRLGSTEPITLYLNSPGGNTAAAETIRKLITAPHPNGGRCRMITAVTSSAASAAADLLAMGDYAIAYPYADIIYHGVSELSRVTTEGATLLATRLKRANERYAERLAQRAFGRFFVRILDFQAEMDEYRSTARDKLTAAALSPLIDRVRQEVTWDIDQALKKAMERQSSIVALEVSVFGNIRKRFPDFSPLFKTAKFEAEMLKAVIDHKAEQNEKQPDYFTGGGAHEAIRDFDLLYDFYFGGVREKMHGLFNNYGELLLTVNERNEFSSLTLSPEDKLKWLKAKVEDKLFYLWYFTMSLCRILQTDDHHMTAIDAYWIGLVDEVPGTALWNLRAVIEASNSGSIA